VPVIETAALTKRYGPVTALDALTVAIEPGIVGLVGANGAGKSTLIKVLLGLLEPTAGAAQVLGRDIVTEGEQVRGLVGYMPEHDCLPPDVSATELVGHLGRVAGLPRAAARERTAEVLRHVGLYEERYRPIGGYSTGMKQRVKLAQALVHDPQLLLLDEPTNGLDPVQRESMLDLIRRIGHEFGISVVLSSHLLEEVERVCDGVVILADGRVVTQGRLDDLRTGDGGLIGVVDGDAGPLAFRLRAAGHGVVQDGARLVVDGDPDVVADAVRDLAAQLDVGLRRVQRKTATLEDVFLAAQGAGLV
jgi:ABC-2 type transport system ATP-binding protein